MIVVSDTSPITNLAQVGQLDLLRLLYGQVVVPQAVHRELLIGGVGVAGMELVARASWVRPRRPQRRQVLAQKPLQLPQVVHMRTARALPGWWAAMLLAIACSAHRGALPQETRTASPYQTAPAPQPPQGPDDKTDVKAEWSPLPPPPPLQADDEGRLAGHQVVQVAHADPFISEIVAAVSARWTVPNQLSPGDLVHLKASVCLQIDDDGKLVKWTWAQNSGNRLFDGSLEALLGSLVTLPRPYGPFAEAARRGRLCPVFRK